MQAFTFDPSDVPDVIEAHGKKLNGDYARLVMDMDAVDVISGYPGPVLLLGGEKDPVVTPDYIYGLYHALRHKRNINGEPNAEIQLWMLQDAGHGFHGKMEEVVARRITLFMQGYDEILTIKVNITDSKLKNNGLYNTSYVSFEAECNNTYFCGKALPGAMDVQKRILMKKIEYKADYIMRGKDYAGEDCDIHIINRDTGNGWEPVVETNSQSLAFLNQPGCCTIAENGKEGLLIHILAKVNGTNLTK
jgi:hypothetical protein